MAQNLGADDKTIHHYLNILASVGLIREIHPTGGGGTRVRKSSKIFLNNTTLMHALQQYLGQIIPKGTERELFFIQSMQNCGKELFYANDGDYKIHETTFEIGGASKSRRQLKEVKEPFFIVKDDITGGFKGEIPLLMFRFCY